MPLLCLHSVGMPRSVATYRQNEKKSVKTRSIRLIRVLYYT